MDRVALRELILKKDAIEREIVDLSEALEANNLGGVSAPLVDAEGFPRADIDIHATRTMRHRLAILNTDHKTLMVQIEAGLVNVLPAASPRGPITGAQAPTRVETQARPTLPPAPPPTIPVAPTGSTPPALGTSTAPVPMEVDDGHSLVPYAEIDEVADDGPAAAAGMSVGDLLLRFGNVTASNHDGLRALARLTQRSVGEVIALLVLRGEARVALQLQPRRWSGAGLLGCHLKPL